MKENVLPLVTVKWKVFVNQKPSANVMLKAIEKPLANVMLKAIEKPLAIVSSTLMAIVRDLQNVNVLVTVIAKVMVIVMLLVTVKRRL